jgi:hypothetical protein
MFKIIQIQNVIHRGGGKAQYSLITQRKQREESEILFVYHI